jgi:hypothetical protein
MSTICPGSPRKRTFKCLRVYEYTLVTIKQNRSIGGRPKVSHLGFQGVSRPYRIGSIKIVSSPHAAHAKARCSKSGLSGVMRVTLMSLPHIGQERRAIEDLVWMVC